MQGVFLSLISTFFFRQQFTANKAFDSPIKKTTVQEYMIKHFYPIDILFEYKGILFLFDVLKLQWWNIFSTFFFSWILIKMERSCVHLKNPAVVNDLKLPSELWCWCKIKHFHLKFWFSFIFLILFFKINVFFFIYFSH